jgi:hypothetical protein
MCYKRVKQFFMPLKVAVAVGLEKLPVCEVSIFGV